MKPITKITLIAFLWMLVISSGSIPGDTIARLQMTHAWWTGTEEISLPADYQPKSRLENIGVIGRDNKRYIPYDVGQSLLMLPGDWLGSQLHNFLPGQDEAFLRNLVVNFSIFIPLNVAVVVACYQFLKLLNFGETLAAISSIIWLVSTTVFHYAQVHQQNNQILLFTLLGYATALTSVIQRKSFFAILSGLSLGFAIIIRTSSIFHVLTVFLFLIGCVAYNNQKKIEIVKFAGLWSVGFIPMIFLGRCLDFWRYGSFFITGQTLVKTQLNTNPLLAKLPPLPDNYPFINSPIVGIWGTLFSPAKSIFIYDPLLIPCLVLGVIFWKRFSPYIQWYLISCAINFGIHLVFYSSLDFWHGDAAWGARYHLTSIHLLFIPLVPVFIEYLLHSQKIIRWLLASILIISIGFQSISLVLRPSSEAGRIYFATPQSFIKSRLSERLVNISCLVNSSFYPDCPSRLKETQSEPLIYKVSLLPFNFTNGRKPILVIWGILLVMAVVSTVKLWFSSMKKLKKI